LRQKSLKQFTQEFPGMNLETGAEALH